MLWRSHVSSFCNCWKVPAHEVWRLFFALHHKPRKAPIRTWTEGIAGKMDVTSRSFALSPAMAPTLKIKCGITKLTSHRNISLKPGAPWYGYPVFGRSHNRKPTTKIKNISAFKIKKGGTSTSSVCSKEVLKVLPFFSNAIAIIVVWGIAGWPTLNLTEIPLVWT